MAFAEQRSTSNDVSAKMLVMKTGMFEEGEEGGGTKMTEWSDLRLLEEAHLRGHRPMNPCPLYERNTKTLFLFFICVEEQRSTSNDVSTEMLVMKTGTLKEGEEGGDTKMIEWSDLRLLEEAHLHGHRPMNPCPLYERTTKTLFVFFICVRGNVSEGWQIQHGCNKARLCYITTQDAGESWSKVTDLTDQLDMSNWATFAVGPGHGIQTESGRLIVPLKQTATMGSNSSKCEPVKETVFLSKENEVYRIPALFYHREEKVIMAFAEQRSTPDDSSTKKLVMKTGKWKEGEEGGDTKMIEWSDLRLLEEAHLCCHRPMNPCPLYERTTKTLFLFFICVRCKVSERCQIKTGCNQTRLCYITTQDVGQSWSEVTDLTDQLDMSNWATFAVGPGHGIQTESGRLIVPLYAYVSSSKCCCCCCWWWWWGGCCLFSPHALYLYRDDKGSKWKLGDMLETESAECQMAEVFDEKGQKSIYCNARSEGGHRVEAFDKGSGFISHPSNLPETGNGCQGSVVCFPAQKENPQVDVNPTNWLLFTHPSDASERIDLGVYLNKSPSDTNAWSQPRVINRGPSGYSDLTYIDDGWFGCLMERGEKKIYEEIAFVAFNYKRI